jgi:hypothetical protein
MHQYLFLTEIICRLNFVEADLEYTHVYYVYYLCLDTHTSNSLQQNLVDILFLSETNIDASFPDAQFSIDNFTMWRADRNKFGGVMVYI